LAIADLDIIAVCVGERLKTAVLLVPHLRQMHVPRIIVRVANVEQAEIVKRVESKRGSRAAIRACCGCRLAVAPP